MLRDSDQSSFLDVLKAPVGMKLTYCVGTSFTLDFSALVSAALASEASLDGISITDAELPPQLLPRLLKDLSNFESKAIVFCQNCRISKIPKEFFEKKQSPKQRLLGLLDATIVCVSPNEGFFHPKVWFLRFDSTDNDKARPMWRLLVASRNLSESRFWEIGAELTGASAKRKHQENKQLASFFKYLSKQCPQNKKAQKLLSKARTDLENVLFEVPAGFNESAFLWKEPTTGVFKIIDPDTYDKIIAVSPFLADGMLKQLSAVKESILITGTKDLHLLKKYPELHKNTYAFKLKDENIELHAKLYFCKHKGKDTTDLYLGSANLTNKGQSKFGGNTEALLKLESDKDLLKSFEKAFIFSNTNKKTLHEWLSTVLESDIVQSQESNKLEEKRKLLDDTRELISGGAFLLHKKSRLRWELSWEGNSIDWPKEVQAKLKIAGDSREYDLKALISSGKKIRLNTSDPQSFLFIRLTQKGLDPCSFYTNAEVVSARASRIKGLASIVAEKASLTDALSGLLTEDNTPTAYLREINGLVSKRSKGKKRSGKTFDSYIESLLLADTNSPESRTLITENIEAFSRKNKLETADLKTFWESLLLARKKVFKDAA